MINVICNFVESNLAIYISAELILAFLWTACWIIIFWGLFKWDWKKYSSRIEVKLKKGTALTVPLRIIASVINFLEYKIKDNNGRNNQENKNQNIIKNPLNNDYRNSAGNYKSPKP